MEAEWKSAQREAPKRGVVHEVLPIVPKDTAPTGHSTKGTLDDPALWQALQACLLVGLADDLGDEFLISGGINMPCAVNRLKHIPHASVPPASTA